MGKNHCVRKRRMAQFSAAMKLSIKHHHHNNKLIIRKEGSVSGSTVGTVSWSQMRPKSNLWGKKQDWKQENINSTVKYGHGSLMH